MKSSKIDILNKGLDHKITDSSFNFFKPSFEDDFAKYDSPVENTKTKLLKKQNLFDALTNAGT